MSNFVRVLRLACRYRWTLAASVACALAVGVLWGANFGAVYPFVEVAFQGESLQQRVAEEIEKAQRTAAELRTDLVRLKAAREKASEGQPSEGQPSKGQPSKGQPSKGQPSEEQPSEEQLRLVERDIATAESRLEAEGRAELAYRWAQPYVDRYFPDDPFRTLVMVTGLLLLGTLVKELFLVANNVLVARLAELATYDLRKLFYRRTLRMDLSAFDEQGTTDLLSRFTHDMQHVSEGLVALFGKLVREPLKMAACLIGAGIICWQLLLLSVVIAPAAGLLIRWLAKALKRANRRAMEEMAQMYNTLEETLRGIKIVKAFTSERQERRRFHQGAKNYYKRAMRIARYDALAHPLTEVFGILVISLALLAGARLALSGETHLLGIQMCPRPLGLGSLLLFYVLLAGAADPIRKLSDVISRLQRAVAASDRIYERLDRIPRVIEPSNPVPCPSHRRDLAFEHVSFDYRPGQPVLQDVSLRIPFGATVAIVGSNGCGKSTLVNLIARFYDPTTGRVLLDGVPLTSIRSGELRAQIGLVAQETVLFDDSVMNNIRYGSPHATAEQVVAAAKQAHAHEFITHALPEGYETCVGSGGSRLSGGQRQRIALARAILRDPSILILDEATSQIDLESEQAIQDALESFVRGRTAVMITHRLAALALADMVVVMHAGRILDTGTHEQLMARCGQYRRLHRLQFQEPGETPDAVAA
ncbi:MAG: ABC transporter ATP-binding protein [Patescibacteria group bacterium]|nr:ABC transporter ATP-binding protein [Patescibacteria group bacterium]